MPADPRHLDPVIVARELRGVEFEPNRSKYIGYLEDRHLDALGKAVDVLRIDEPHDSEALRDIHVEPGMTHPVRACLSDAQREAIEAAPALIEQQAADRDALKAEVERLQGELVELHEEARLFDEEAGENLRLIDSIARFLGVPDDEELELRHVRDAVGRLERERDAQAARADAADSALARCREALDKAEDRLRPDALRLMAGEMTAQEVRTAQAVGRAIIAQIRAALAATPSPSGWQPIETAPKDGTEVLLAAPGFSTAIPGKWLQTWGVHENTWVTPGYSSPIALRRAPTHWKPLPHPPSTPDRTTAGSETP